MEPTKRIDLAIIGGGCAGLSLARELACRQTSKTVILLESRTHYHDDRSWCFWSTRQHKLSYLVSHVWSDWMFGRQGSPNAKKSSTSHPYQYIRSTDFYEDCFQKIAQCPSIECKLGLPVINVVPLQDAWRIETEKESFMATHVIDTRPPTIEQFEQASLFQCFLGFEILLTDGTNVDPSTLELMTDMRMLDDEFCFTYVLPLSRDRFIIELTLFAKKSYSSQELQKALNQLIEKRGFATESIIRTEYGILPMGLPTSQTIPPRAGMGGGALRPSSGYGFLRIQRWAEKCAEHYCAHGSVIPQSVSGFLVQKMDQLFLKVLNTQPDLAPKLFEQLLGITQTERFIRFMNDRANFFDYLHIVLCLPKLPFIQAIFSTAPHRK